MAFLLLASHRWENNIKVNLADRRLNFTGSEKHQIMAYSESYN
jgi:hypothetical protein